MKLTYNVPVHILWSWMTCSTTTMFTIFPKPKFCYRPFFCQYYLSMWITSITCKSGNGSIKSKSSYSGLSAGVMIFFKRSIWTGALNSLSLSTRRNCMVLFLTNFAMVYRRYFCVYGTDWAGFFLGRWTLYPLLLVALAWFSYHSIASFYFGGPLCSILLVLFGGLRLSLLTRSVT